MIAVAPDSTNTVSREEALAHTLHELRTPLNQIIGLGEMDCAARESPRRGVSRDGDATGRNRSSIRRVEPLLHPLILGARFGGIERGFSGGGKKKNES